MPLPEALNTPVEDDDTATLLAWHTAVPERRFVRVVTCLSPDFDFVAYARDHLDALRHTLYEHGALLVRGLPPQVDRFAELCDLFGPPGRHSELSSARTDLGHGVYTSTDHPADQKIQLHNEQAYLGYWPLVTSFMCVTASRTGGQTPLADCRDFDRELPPALAERLRTQGVRYVRNIGAESILPWKTVYRVDSREALEAYCASRGIEVSWKPDGTPRTTSPLPAYVRHPVTGDDCFFNNVVSASYHSLSAAQREHIQHLFPTVLDHPNAVLFGDGEPIGREDVEAVMAAYERRGFEFDWRPGDMLIADNLLVAHGRNAFEGPRKVIVRINDVRDAVREGLWTLPDHPALIPSGDRPEYAPSEELT